MLDASLFQLVFQWLEIISGNINLLVGVLKFYYAGRSEISIDGVDLVCIQYCGF